MIISHFYSLNTNFKYIFEMKELYIKFNSTIHSSNSDIESSLDDLISCYSNSHLTLFKRFASLLKNQKEGIIHSFTYINGRRLSNGPIESFNRKIKDIKRSSRGYSNFETLRRRILCEFRKNEAVKNYK